MRRVKNGNPFAALDREQCPARRPGPELRRPATGKRRHRGDPNASRRARLALRAPRQRSIGDRGKRKPKQHQRYNV